MVEFSKLAGAFEAYSLSEHMPETAECIFLRKAGFIAPPAKPDPADYKFLLTILRLAGRCQRVFQLRHQGHPAITMIGATLAAGTFGTAQPDAIFAGGRGHGFRDALIGCMCEMAERVASRVWSPPPAPSDVTSIQSLLPLWCAANGMIETLTAEHMIIGSALHDGASLSFPWTGRTGIFGSSSGCAVGTDHQSATLRAALEVLERDAVALWWRYQSSPRPLADQTALDAIFPITSARKRWLLDLTTNRRIPVVAALSSDADGRGMIMGAAADLTLTDAAKRAALELCQMEASAHISAQKQSELGEARLTTSDRSWLDRMAMVVPDHAYPSGAPQARGHERLANEDVIKALGSAYAFDLSIPKFPISVIRVVAPTLRTMATTYVAEDTALNEAERALREDIKHLPSPI